MKIALYGISNPEGIDLKTYVPESKGFYLDLEIYIKTIYNGVEKLEVFDTSIFNIEGYIEHLRKSSLSAYSFTPKGILCDEYDYNVLYDFVDGYIKRIKPKNVGEFGLLILDFFESHDSFLDNKIYEIKHYISMSKR